MLRSIRRRLTDLLGSDRPGSRRVERGAVIPFVAIGISSMILGTSFAVDINRIGQERRRMEKVVDLVVLDASRQLIGASDPGSDTLSDRRVAVADAAEDAARRNELFGAGPVARSFDGNKITFTQGDQRLEIWMWGWDPSTQDYVADNVAARFLSGRATSDVDFLFYPGEYDTHRDAVASKFRPLEPLEDCDPVPLPCLPTTDDPDPWEAADQAGFSLGSFLVGLDTTVPSTTPSAEVFAEVKSDFMNAWVGAALNPGITTPDAHLGLDLVGWRGIGASALDLGDLATRLGVGSVDQLLSTSVTHNQLLVAMAEVLDANGQVAAANALNQVRTDIAGTTSFRLGDTIRASQGTGQGAAAMVNALELFLSSAMITGNDFLTTEMTLPLENPLTPEADLLVARLDVALIEPPVTAYGPAELDPATGLWRTAAETTQVNAQLTIQLPGLDVAGTSVTANLPLALTAAEAVADLRTVECSLPINGSYVGLGTVTGGLDVHIGQVVDLTSDTPTVVAGELVAAAASPSPVPPVTTTSVAGLPGVTVPPTPTLPTVPLPGLVGSITGLSTLSVGGSTGAAAFQDVPFNDWFDLGVPPPHHRIVGGTTADLGSGLAGTLVLDGPVGATTLVQNQLGFVFDALDNEVLRPLASALGVGVGGADLNALGLECGIPVLIG